MWDEGHRTMLIWKGCARRGASEEAGSNAFVRFGLFYNVSQVSHVDNLLSVSSFIAIKN